MTTGFHPFGGRISDRFSSRLSPDEAYLIYHDVRLTRADVESIKSDWLTDNVISFWEEYLEHEKLKAYPRAKIVLLRPSMTLMLSLTPDPTTLRDSLPNFSETTHVFIPVTDCKTPDVAEGGSHWSLLLVSIIDRVAFHYDSLGGANEDDGEIVARNLGKLLGKELRFTSIEDCPIQENGSDCGVFVCLLMQHLLLNRLLMADAKVKVPMTMAGKEVNATLGRKEITKIINQKREEAQKKESKSRSVSPFRSKENQSKSPPRIGDD